MNINDRIVVLGGYQMGEEGEVVGIAPDGEVEVLLDNGDREFYRDGDLELCEVESAAAYEEPWDGFRDDVEADADVLRSAGWGMDEDYGHASDVL